jgi:hypothetical protein
MKKSKNIKKLQAHQYVDTEYEIEFADILRIINSCTEEEKYEIIKIVCVKKQIEDRSDEITFNDDRDEYPGH